MALKKTVIYKKFYGFYVLFLKNMFANSEYTTNTLLSISKPLIWLSNDWRVADSITLFHTWIFFLVLYVLYWEVWSIS